jgi:hypothetical protein
MSHGTSRSRQYWMQPTMKSVQRYSPPQKPIEPRGHMRWQVVAVSSPMRTQSSPPAHSARIVHAAPAAFGRPHRGDAGRVPVEAHAADAGAAGRRLERIARAVRLARHGHPLGRRVDRACVSAGVGRQVGWSVARRLARRVSPLVGGVEPDVRRVGAGLEGRRRLGRDVARFRQISGRVRVATTCARVTAAGGRITATAGQGDGRERARNAEAKGEGRDGDSSLTG